MTLTVLMALWLASIQTTSTVRVEFSSSFRQGDVVVALFASPETWDDRSRPLRVFTAPVSPRPDVVFDGLAPGRYAILAFHDKNSDGKLDITTGGLPAEAYGFSRNARSALGPPSWDSASFEVSGDTVQRIRVR